MKVQLMSDRKVVREYEGQCPNLGERVILRAVEKFAWPLESIRVSQCFVVAERQWIFDDVSGEEMVQVSLKGEG